jgi:beta-galactosidase
VPYAPGVLEARGFKNGRLVLRRRRETAGAPARLVLRADRTRLAADGEDAAVVAVEVQDARGRIVPIADNPIRFALAGPGALIGVGNGDPTSLEPDKSDARRAFNGLCMVIAQAERRAGEIMMRASSPGLVEGRLTLVSRSGRTRPSA